MFTIGTLKEAWNTLWSTQSSAEDQIKENSSTFNQQDNPIGQINEQVNNSNVWIRGNAEDGYYLILGNYRLSQKIDYLWQAKEIAEQTDWTHILGACAVMIELALELKKLEKEAGIPAE